MTKASAVFCRKDNFPTRSCPETCNKYTLLRGILLQLYCFQCEEMACLVPEPKKP